MGEMIVSPSAIKTLQNEVTELNDDLSQKYTTLNNKLTWENVTIPTPSVNGNKRTYAISGLNGKHEVCIAIQPNGYDITRQVIILPVISGASSYLHYYRAVHSSYTFIGSVWISNDLSSIIFETDSSSYTPGTFYICPVKICVR